MRKRLNLPKRNYRGVLARDLSGGMNKRKDSRTLDFSVAEEASNVVTESGALRDGYGVEGISAPEDLERFYYYSFYDENAGGDRGYYLAYDSADGGIYASVALSGSWNKIAGAEFAASPSGVNYRLYGEDVYLLCGAEGMAVINSALTATMATAAPEVTSLAMHNERMFVTIGGRKNAVWFSDDLDPTNWNPELDEGGFIELEGESGRLNRVVDFGGYVYIFRDYGISRLYAYGSQSDFSVSNLFVSSGKIRPESVAVCGDRIIFFAGEGLYAFDGVSATRICRALDGIFSDKVAPLGCYCADKYYLSAGRADPKGGGYDLLVVVDPRTGTFSVSTDLGIEAFSPIATREKEELLVFTTGGAGRVTRCGALFGNPLRKVWRSGLTDLGSPDRRKLVTEVYIDTRHDLTLTVSTERSTKTFRVKGSNGVSRKRVNVIGTKVSLEISADGEADAARPCVKYAVL